MHGRFGRLVLTAAVLVVSGCNCGGGLELDAGTGGGAGGGAGGGGGFDAGDGDAGAVDAGAQDAGTDDAGTDDAGVADAGSPDAGPDDAGVADAGSPDAGPADAGTDAGMLLRQYATQVASSGFHVLIVGEDGGLWARGRYDCGQDGQGGPVNMCGNANRSRATSVRVSALTSAVASIHAFGHNSYALLEDRSLWAWGQNCSGLGISCFATASNAMTSTPVRALVEPAVQVDIGDSWGLALLEDAGVHAWGYNLAGQLGDGTTTSRSTPAPVPGAGPSLHVAAGREHGLSLLPSGTVWAWGRNQRGQLGNGTNQSSAPGVVPGLTDVRRVYANGDRSYALKSDGTVWAWGENGGQRLGIGTMPMFEVTTPTQLPGLSDVTALSVDCFHGLAVKSDGTVWMWGGTPPGSTVHTPVPVQVPGISSARAVFCEAFNSYVLLADGRMLGWGYASQGELGAWDGGSPVEEVIEVHGLY
jgi:hypothetical protein